ncbi:MAG: hypothetical protein ACYCPA_12460 [Acidithiobacillus sp.]
MAGRLQDREEAQEVLALAKDALASIRDWMETQQLVSRSDLDKLDSRADSLPFNMDGQREDASGARENSDSSTKKQDES